MIGMDFFSKFTEPNDPLCGFFSVLWWFQGECRLQMEAQRLSLSQIHAAQFELLQEETEALSHSLELKLQEPGGGIHHRITWLVSLPVAFVNLGYYMCKSLFWLFSAGPKPLQSINVSQVVRKECTEIIEVFLRTGGYYWQPPNDLIRSPCSCAPRASRRYLVKSFWRALR